MKKAKRKAIKVLEELEVPKVRFIRWAGSRQNFQLTYSVTFKRWRKNKKLRKLVKAFKRSDYWPAQVNEICNIIWVLEKKCGMKIGQGIIGTAIDLWEGLQGDISDYYVRVYVKTRKFKLCTPRQALKEQKARGFIHINDFEDFDPEYSHVRSNVDRDYFYPLNLAHSASQYKDNPGSPGVYGGQSAIGVRGHTQASIAINRKPISSRRILD